MNIRLIIIFYVTLLIGCGTVTKQELADEFDNVAAADARITLGLRYLDMGNRLKARENLELAMKYAPNYYRSLSSLAYYYQLVGEEHLARQAYEKAMKEFPENSELLNNYGAFLCRLGYYQQADGYFNRVIEQPESYQVVDSYENAAICSLKSGDLIKAEYYFERSLDYDPYRYFSLFQLAKLKLHKGEYSDIRERLVKFHNTFGYQPGSLSLLIAIEKKAGNKVEAEHYTTLLESQFPGFTKH